VSSEPTGTSGFAGRYAAALFELADDSGAIDTVADDLAGLQELIETVSELAYLIRSPLLSRDEQGRAMDAVLDAAGVSDLTKRFIGVVAANRRLFALSEMIRGFHALLARHRGEVSAEVTSATPLSEAQLAAVSDALKQVIGVNVTLTARVEPEIIGGLIVQVGSRMVDSSLRTKLDRLELAMRGAA
jgi:F-type H+-transporting ATPase subunit delta